MTSTIEFLANLSMSHSDNVARCYATRVTVGDPEELAHIIETDVFRASLHQEGPHAGYAFSTAEVEGVFQALVILDQDPTAFPGSLRLHALKRQDRPWWSITPTEPAGTDVRVLVKPEQRGGKGRWIVGPVTRHYQAPPAQ